MVCEPLVVGIAAKKTFSNDCPSKLRLAYVVSSNFSCSASVLHLAAISVDRFLAVIFPLRHGRIMKNYGLKIMLIVVWGVATVFASLRVPFLEETNYVAFVTFIIDYFLIIGCYLYITISVILLRRRKKPGSTQSRTLVSVGSKVERRFAFTLAIVIGVFTACWVPFMVVGYGVGKPLVKLYGTAYMWTTTLALLNSAMNFLIYSARIRDFRDSYVLICRKILRCNWCDLIVQLYVCIHATLQKTEDIWTEINSKVTNYIKLSTFNRNIREYQSTYQTLLIVTTISTYTAQVSAFSERWFASLQVISQQAYFLEVNKKASNIACRAELGRFLLNITINQKNS